MGNPAVKVNICMYDNEFVSMIISRMPVLPIIFLQGVKFA